MKRSAKPRLPKHLVLKRWSKLKKSVKGERLRERAIALHDPVGDLHWTLWQALAWVAYRDADKVRDCAEDALYLGLPNRIWREIGFVLGTSKASVELMRALEAGKLIATGIDPANEVRREIKSLEWLDLEFLGLIRPRRPGRSSIERDRHLTTLWPAKSNPRCGRRAFAPLTYSRLFLREPARSLLALRP